MKTALARIILVLFVLSICLVVLIYFGAAAVNRGDPFILVLPVLVIGSAAFAWFCWYRKNPSRESGL